ncbi:MAG TPA: copper transporter [Gaiellaceae bacterium]|nr:copper transporter [Gaiellaceae bacterium]
MFDLRYHVASLAAVFLMLVVGILIGVGISGRGFVDDAERKQLEGKIEGLQGEVDAANANADDFELRQQAAEDFVESAYPVLAAKRLEGKKIAILVLGPVDASVSAIERAVEEDGGGRVARMRSLVLPLRLDAVAAAVSAEPEFGGYVGDGQLGNLGRDLGRELVSGGETPLWDALESELVEVRVGGLADPVDGVIVMRTAEPQAGESSRFLAGIYQGLGSAGVPVVGVEPSSVDQSGVEQSAIPAFQRHRLSTVDGIDTPVGALAVLLVLADLDAAGDYGVRDTADRILPPIEPLAASGG